MADIKVIVTEACNCFLAMAVRRRSRPARKSLDSGCSIRMEFDSRPDAFVISVLYPEKRGLVSWLEGCDPMSEAGLGLTILKALTDEMVEVDSEAEGTVLRLDQAPAGLSRPARAARRAQAGSAAGLVLRQPC